MGLNHDELGSVYSEIQTWRTRLKMVNEVIRIAQEEGYQAIVDGVHVKGRLLTGRGLRLLPGIQLIKGCAKEDVRWDILQMGGSDGMNQVVFWTVVMVIAASLLLGRELFSFSPSHVCRAYLQAVIATAGLAVATSPDFAHYLLFFQSLANHNNLPTSLATVLAPPWPPRSLCCLQLALHRKY
jgi:hypothetical protein